MTSRPIACCIDFSPLGATVLNEATVLARALGAELVLIHAAQTEAPLTSGGVAPSRAHTVPAYDLGERRQKLAAEVERLRAGGLAVRGEVLSDESPAEATLEAAEKAGCGHIVCGSHGHAMVFELLVGSFTNAILRKTKIPVVVVPVSRTEV